MTTDIQNGQRCQDYGEPGFLVGHPSYSIHQTFYILRTTAPSSGLHQSWFDLQPSTPEGVSRSEN